MSDPFETRIDRLELENFRLFKSLQIDFHPQLTVLTAPNGGGKTSVLDAVRKLLQPYIDGLTRGNKPSQAFNLQDVRQVGATRASGLVLRAHGYLAGDRTDDPMNPIVLQDNWRLELTVGNNGSIRQRLFGDLPAHASGLALMTRLIKWSDGEPGGRPVLPVLAYFDTERRFAPKGPSRPSEKTKPVVDPLDTYLTWDHCQRDYAVFEDWFWRHELTARDDELDRGPGWVRSSDARAVVNAALASLAPHLPFARLTWDKGSWELCAARSDGLVLPVRRLSDGFSAMIAMVCDLAYRCLRLNPHLGTLAPQLTDGIVLIDEVDMHLHPAWQQTVIASLTIAFPMIQFIVTTHSPQVLSTVDRQSIRILHADGTVTLPRYQTRGVASADVLATAMDVDPIPDVPEWAKLRQYHAFIERGAWQGPDAVALRAELDAHFGAEHPLMLDCERLIRFQAFKLRRSPTGQESP